MACPYFDPAGRLETGAWQQAPRLPLGELRQGVCRARPGEPYIPDSDHMRECCNFGYARSACARFPGGPAPDAVRFGIALHTEDTVKLHYVAEHDHHPFAYALLEYDLTARCFRNPPEDEVIARQACVYMEIYLARKSCR